ncbi:MAG TPA: 3'(2'),5'-bisphosphate nucleotidase CysQ [Micromonosporaceae bacterium]|jgi:3'(2'), 5'-bisphosphate nucleotidase|nr:3'(2'),5'-bisphosphate nucleotidase CysQ [Micromonosporaceae bacterium]
MSPPVVDGAFARWLAARAGELLIELRTDFGYGDPAGLRAEGDKRSHDLITSELARWRPADAVLSEEGAHTDPTRLTAERVWIVDPLDGTREYAEEGRSDWAVHVALWSAGKPRNRLVAGAVALPAQQRVYATDRPPAYPPMTLAAAGVAGPVRGPLRIAVSRTRPPDFLTALAGLLGAELVPMGSAGAKIAAVIGGDVDAYVHAGGQYEWDSAAPVAVATATGLHASRIDGSALKYNQADPRLPDLVVCRKNFAPRLLAALAVRG